jgi:hypothetical protein
MVFPRSQYYNPFMSIEMKVRCSHTKLVPLSKLKAHPKNTNTHTAEQVVQLAKIMEYQGVRAAIRVSKQTDFITAGHGRLLAAKHNGWTHFPVDYQDYDSEDQETIDVTADNAIAMQAEIDMAMVNSLVPELGPDIDLEWLGFKDFALDPADKQGETGDDEVPEPAKPIVKPGELYILGDHRLLCGDSTDSASVARLMNGEKADMVFTDPPYGADIVNRSGKLGGDKPFGNIGNMRGEIVKAGRYAPIVGDETTDTAKKAFQVLDAKTKVFWGAQYYAESLPPSSGWIVWDKQTDGSLGDGELAYTNQKKAIRIFQHKWSGMLKASERQERRCHPTQKPIALAEWVFENYGDPKTVLDGFLGSGSALIACEKTNRKCFGMEIDPVYCGVILDRWAKFTGKEPHREDGTPWSTIKANS